MRLVLFLFLALNLHATTVSIYDQCFEAAHASGWSHDEYRVTLNTDGLTKVELEEFWTLIFPEQFGLFQSIKTIELPVEFQDGHYRFDIGKVSFIVKVIDEGEARYNINFLDSLPHVSVSCVADI